MNADEEWRAIPGFNGYEASSLGGVRSWIPGRRTRGFLLAPVILKQGDREGYRHVNLCRDRRKFFKQVHRLVLMAFAGEPATPDIQCRHLNGVRSDNRVVNLAWGTAQDNSNDRAAHGTQRYKLSAADVVAIRNTDRSITHQFLADQYGVSRCTIKLVRNRHRRHKVPDVAPAVEQP